MEPVIQTMFGKDKGNCFQAVIASIFEMNIDEVPNFMEGVNQENAHVFVNRLNEWLRPMGLYYLEVTGHLAGPCICELSGKSPRGDFNHAVVGRGSKVIHDPHPSDDGLEDERKTTGLFVALDPSKFKLPDRQPEQGRG